ncbi:MAG: cyclic-di-AMP receptor [Anaerolineae bacterium]|uniref:Cyclic-di-AMP receptor n=1 Tax=Candidatus Desulfolinea nitratireducens TaxID=2841698 RepID=A0A8J6THV2_9CHLR|nr:cyclic-di-AMP receptor [Candidatus Desulfolinea nitratireducens]MBL6961724.1 cyclic-di-AMP receptor [Anaerolineales bacterium]NQU31271.1 cyclic-di-AMP receptor [Anaerolineae bacterium]
MKLILAVVRDIDSESIIRSLVKAGYRVTRLASMGGFLHRGNMTLMIGVEDGQEQVVIDLMREAVGPPEKEQHRVTLFLLDAIGSEHF